MRKNFLICALMLTAMILCPLFSMRSARQTPVPTAANVKADDDGIVSVMLAENGKVEKLETREYLVGALAAEMNISYHEEALKAQVVACYTYEKYIESKGANSDLNGADISDDSAVHQGYISQEDRKKKWGGSFEENEKKAEKAVDAVYGRMMTVGGEPILAAYHDLNSGVTESAETVWGKDISYLQPVQSSGDKLSPDYSSTVILNKSEFMSRAVKIKGIAEPEEENWVKNVKTSKSGYVISLELGGREISGEDFRKAFELKSCCFTVDEGEKFTVKTIGGGHAVGMSQYGADYMARQGADWREILNHYYKGVKIV